MAFDCFSKKKKEKVKNKRKTCCHCISLERGTYWIGMLDIIVLLLSISVLIMFVISDGQSKIDNIFNHISHRRWFDRPIH